MIDTSRLFIRRLAGVVAGLAVTSGAAAAQPGGGAQPQPVYEYLVVGSGGGGEGNVGHVTTFRVDRATGDLTRIDQKQVGGLASYIAKNPRHPVLYVTAERGGAMHWIQIEPATGAITIGGSQAGNGNPVYTSVDANGLTMFGVNHARGTTDAYPLDPATGAIAGAPTNYRTGANSHSAVFHPENGHVYVASVADSMISQYSFSGGTLTPLNPASLPQPGGPRHFTFHPSGEFAYVVAGPTDLVGMFQVGADGRLTSLGSVPRLPAGLGSEAATHMGSDIHVHPSGRFAYASNRGTNNTLAIYSVGGDGRLTPRGHESTRGNTPRTFAIDSAGELLAVGNQDSQTVALFRVSGDTGALTHLHTEEVEVSPWFVGFFRF